MLRPHAARGLALAALCVTGLLRRALGGETLREIQGERAQVPGAEACCAGERGHHQLGFLTQQPQSHVPGAGHQSGERLRQEAGLGLDVHVVRASPGGAELYLRGAGPHRVWQWDGAAGGRVARGPGVGGRSGPVQQRGEIRDPVRCACPAARAASGVALL